MRFIASLIGMYLYNRKVYHLLIGNNLDIIDIDIPLVN